jgi:Transglutaminase-like superfamily
LYSFVFEVFALKSYRLYPVLLLILVVGITICSGCSSLDNNISQSLLQVQPDDSPWSRHFKNSLGRDWYEVKFVGLRVGRAKKERNTRVIKGKPVYQFILDEESRLQILGTTNSIKRYEERIFSAEYPYSLISYTFEENAGGNKVSVQIERTGPGSHEYTVVEGKRRGQKTLHGQYYTLEDELDFEMWLQAEPVAGESETFYQLMPGRPEMDLVTFTVQDVSYEQIDGKTTKMYEILTSREEERLAHFKIGENGQLSFMSNSGGSEYYLRKQKPPLPARNSADIYTHNIIPITQTIGTIDKLKSVQLSITGPSVELLESSPGQQVTCTEKSSRCQIILGGEITGEAYGNVRNADIEKYSEATSRIMSDHPDVMSMAKEVVGDTTLTTERVDKLVKFVGDYLSGEYVFHTNVIDLLKDKKGDCTEHALLFAALARSLDIPCREVSGLIYMGDWCQGFGLHGWNEVVVDGRWQGVDASHDTSAIQPIYIRFPDDPFKSVLLIEATHKLTIDIEEVVEIE